MSTLPSDKELQAIKLLLKHPDWTDEQIAKKVGVHRRTLYRWPRYMKARLQNDEERRSSVPRGRRVVDQDDPTNPSDIEADCRDDEV
jgi:hypothetical protein